MSARATAAGTLDGVTSQLRAALASQIASLRDPEEPSADFFVSPEVAWESLDETTLAGFAERVARAGELLDLDALSLEALWLCAAPELDDGYGRVFAFLLDNASRRLPTARLIASVLAGEDVEQSRVLACFGSEAPLRRLGCVHLVEGESALPLADQPIRVAGELVGFLLGTSLGDPGRAAGLVRREPPNHPLGRASTLARIRAALSVRGRAPVMLSGPDAVDLLAQAVGRGLILLDARHAGEADLLSRGALIAALEQRRLVVHCDVLEPTESTALKALIEAVPERALLCAATPEAVSRLDGLGAILVDVPMPTRREREEAWGALATAADTSEVAAKFRLSIEQIAQGARIAQAEAELAGKVAPSAAELDAGARQASSSGLGEHAIRVAPGGGWRDLVLPDRQLELLQSISSYLRHRDQVLTEWGYERTLSGRQGLGVLFAGESGTGKTMAARVLAADLGLELFSIGLSSVVSKYVGETEKNLERIFAAAEGSNAILFFDEADALFGRRSGVSDSRDRYANIEVAFLLQRMEAHPGAVILATNLKQNLDDAFLRRLDFVVDFRFPEAADRRQLWRLVIPREAPVADDIDYDFLADNFKLSGGSIRNCSLAAAFEAAAAREPVRMAHLVRAVAAEYSKLGRLTVETDFGPYLPMLRDPDAARTAADTPVPEPEAPAAPARATIGSRIEEL